MILQFRQGETYTIEQTYWPRFTDMPKTLRYDCIVDLCHLTGSRMRDLAIRSDPPCVTACVVDNPNEDGGTLRPVGWAIAATTRPHLSPLVMVYVAEHWRRKGLGTKLIKALQAKAGGGPIRYVALTQAAREFFRQQRKGNEVME